MDSNAESRGRLLGRVAWAGYPLTDERGGGEAEGRSTISARWHS
jgi:hypothetical protein